MTKVIPALFILFSITILSNAANPKTTVDPDAQYRKDLTQINYYNWLLHRHRTETAKIEKINSDIKEARLNTLKGIMNDPHPHSVTLITTDSEYKKIFKYLHPLHHTRVKESAEALNAMFSPKSRPTKDGKAEGLVEFQLSEEEYRKFSKFLDNKTVKKSP